MVVFDGPRNLGTLFCFDFGRRLTGPTSHATVNRIRARRLDILDRPAMSATSPTTSRARRSRLRANHHREDIGKPRFRDGAVTVGTGFRRAGAKTFDAFDRR